MNNDMMLQSLTEAFEILKDSWDTKSKSIVNCIVETEQYDGSLAMEMWYYVIQNNLSQTSFFDVLNRFGSKYAKYGLYRYYAISYSEHVTEHIVNEKLVASIFGVIVDSSNCNIDNDDCVHFLPAFVASILLSNKPILVKTMINSMVKNDKLINSSISNLLTNSNLYIEDVRNNIDNFDKDYKVTDSVKEVLFNSISTISDKMTRAECTIAILSF